MRRVSGIETSGSADGADVVRLDHDQRTRRRMVFTTQAGASILLDMPRPVRLRDGDWLRLEDGALVRVEATNESLIEISTGSDAQLVRIAWHLGNRHLPTQLLPGANGGALRIRYDHVIMEMVEGLGGDCLAILAPFDPEGGAYEHAAGGQSHSHSRGDHHHHHHEHHHEHHH